MRNIEHERGAFAYSKVYEVKDKSWAGDYKSYVKRAPAMIMTNGLAQTLAFYKAKGKPAYDALFNHVNEWLAENWLKKRGLSLESCKFKVRARNGEIVKKAENVLEWLVHCASDMEVYQAMTEVLALLNWLRRFADAMIEKQETGE